MDLGTTAVHAGLPDADQGAPFLPGPTFAGTYHFRGDPDPSAYTYGRTGNPTWTRLEDALGELEGGETVVFSSGMAAMTALLSCAGADGGSVVLPSDGYHGIRTFVEEDLRRSGIEVRMIPTRAEWGDEVLEGVRLVCLETPSNPALDVCDVRAITARAHDHGALVAVDNTTATPVGQRPLDLGADFSVASDTKGLTGHDDLVLGHVACRDPEWAERVRARRSLTGAVPGPMEAWLAHRSLATLDVRHERQCANAARTARLLVKRGDVTGVRYPGLESDPAHRIASQQMRRYGSVVSFELSTQDAAERFLASSRLIAEATSFGGVHSTAERRARWRGDDVGPGFIRLNVGCEVASDLEEDILGALDAVRG